MSRSDEGDEFRHPWDPRIVEALRAASAQSARGSNLTELEAHLTAADRTALEAQRPYVLERLLARVAAGRPEPVLAYQRGDAEGRRMLSDTSFLDEDAEGMIGLSVASTVRSEPMNTAYKSVSSQPEWCDAETDDRPVQPVTHRFQEMIRTRRLDGPGDFPLLNRLGKGVEGVVYRTVRGGSDGYASPLAVKLFSPEKYPSLRCYEAAMSRMGRVASDLAWPQHEHLVGVYGFEVRDQVRVMFMELADGYDLRRLLRLKIVPRLRRNLGEVEWEKFRRVVIGEGPDQLQVKPFIALAIVRECLAGLRSLHERNIVHGDIKPENLILLRSGHPKIIDYGAAFRTETPPRTFIHTPAYAAVEVLESHERTPRSDLASLGYVLVELLTGKRLFAGLQTVGQCLQVKRDLPHRLWDLLPEGVRSDRWLIEFCQRLIDPRPERRFISAEDADLNSMHGAHAHFSQLYKDGLGVAHENEINRWVNSAMKRANE